MSLKENEQTENRKQKGYMKKSTFVIILLLLVLIFIGILILVLFFGKETKELVLDPMSGKYESDIELPEETDPYYIRIPGVTTIYVAEGADTAKAVLWNPDSNPCYFQYSIVLTDTEEMIYESGMIAPGNAVTEVKFNRTFTQGVYPITLRVASCDLTDYEKAMNGGEIQAELIAVVEGGE